jgi:hydroxyacid-oxoacid transhydrogenase
MVKLPTGFSRQQVSSLLSRVHKTHCGCPMCSSLAAAAANSPADILNAANAIRTGGRAKVLHRAPSAGPALSYGGAARGYATPVDAPQGDYAFEVAASNLRFGEGVTKVRLDPSLAQTPEPSLTRTPRM